MLVRRLVDAVADGRPRFVRLFLNRLRHTWRKTLVLVLLTIKAILEKV
jgi:hypothetical protein